MPLRDFNPIQDYINDEALAKLEEFVQKVPRDVSLGNAQAHIGSVTVTLYFHDRKGPIEQAEALDNLVNAAMFMETLVLNLREARKDAKTLRRPAKGMEALVSFDRDESQARKEHIARTNHPGVPDAVPE